MDQLEAHILKNILIARPVIFVRLAWLLATLAAVIAAIATFCPLPAEYRRGLFGFYILLSLPYLLGIPALAISLLPTEPQKLTILKLLCRMGLVYFAGAAITAIIVFFFAPTNGLM